MTQDFATLSDFRAILADLPEADHDVLTQAADHNMPVDQTPRCLGAP